MVSKSIPNSFERIPQIWRLAKNAKVSPGSYQKKEEARETGKGNTRRKNTNRLAVCEEVKPWEGLPVSSYEQNKTFDFSGQEIN